MYFLYVDQVIMASVHGHKPRGFAQDLLPWALDNYMLPLLYKNQQQLLGDSVLYQKTSLDFHKMILCLHCVNKQKRKQTKPNVTQGLKTRRLLLPRYWARA